MLRTLPAIHELLSDMDGKIFGCDLSLPVRSNSTSVISHTSCEMDNQVSFQPSGDWYHFNCELDFIAPYDHIIPKLTHMEVESHELPAAVPADGAECVNVDGESCFHGVNAELVNEALWKKFYNAGHEMIVTKIGRYVTVYIF